MEAEIVSVRPVRDIKVKGMDARVVDIELVNENTKGVLTGWNIYAEFLYWLLSEKTVIFLIGLGR